MPKDMKIPAYRVSFIEGKGTKERVMQTQEFKGPPGSDFFDYRYGVSKWDNVRVRAKTYEGAMQVTFRDQTGGDTKGQVLTVQPGENAVMKNKAGNVYQVRVEPLPKKEWALGAAIKFSPPRATIVGLPNGGWSVTFEPQQYPCVLTVAVELNGTKDEALPSMPFPSNPKFKSGTFQLKAHQFKAQAGGIIRLGVRGAGLSTRLKLPEPGKTVEVSPDAFETKGAAQPELMADAYVTQKYGEKHGLVRYQ